MIKWIKTKTGDLVAKDTAARLVIVALPPKAPATYPTFRLDKDGVPVYEGALDAGRRSGKLVAEAVAAGRKPLYKKVLVGVPDQDKAWYTREVKALGRERLPRIDGPNQDYFFEMAEKGVTPKTVSLTPTYLKEGNLEGEELPDAYLASLYVRVLPRLIVGWRAKERAERKERKANKVAFKASSEPREPSPSVAEVEPEAYKGPPPPFRSKEGLARISCVTESDPLPRKPEDAKFSTLLAWAEEVRDHYKEKKKFPTIGYLIHGAQHAFGSFDRGQKAGRRLRLVYADEAAHHDLVNKALFLPKSNTEEDKPTLKSKEAGPSKGKRSKEKDKWGFREGTRASRINAVLSDTPMSIKKIAAKADCTPASAQTHLANLCNRKLAKKLDDGKYRLFRRKK